MPKPSTREELIEEMEEDRVHIIGQDPSRLKDLEVGSYYGNFPLSRKWVAYLIFEYGL